MRGRLLIFFLLAGVLAPARLRADEQAWRDANKQIESLVKQGKYSEATAPAEQAVSLARELSQSRPEYLGKSMTNLANLYFSQGRAKEAEALYLDAIRFEKNNLGADFPHLADIHYNLGMFYRAAGRKDLARFYFGRAFKIKQKELGKDAPELERFKQAAASG